MTGVPTAKFPVKRAKFLFSVLNGSTPASGEAEFWDGDIPWATPDDIGKLQGSTLRSTRRKITEAGFQSCGTNLAPAGSIVMTTRAPVGNLALAGIPLCTNQGCKTLVPLNSHFDARYFYYQLFTQTEELNIRATGTTFLELGTQDLRDFPLFNPKPEEQRGIADFLDRETARLDALVVAKKRWLELLVEKRRALITHTVTRGLNPKTLFRDSGLPWLGQIPNHWQAKRLRHISDFIVVGVVVNPSSYVTDEGVVFLLGGDVREMRIDTNNCKRCSPESSDGPLRKSRLDAGDIVVVRVGYPGVAAVVPPELAGGNVASMMLVRKHARFCSQWLAYAFNSQVGRDQVEIVQYGAAQKQFNISHAIDFAFPFPPLREQITIATYLDSETMKLDALRAATERTLELLKERRAALIAAAVTGNIKIRQTA